MGATVALEADITTGRKAGGVETGICYTAFEHERKRRGRKKEKKKHSSQTNRKAMRKIKQYCKFF